MPTCGHCGKDIGEADRPDYSAVKGLVHHECDVRYYQNLIPSARRNEAGLQTSCMEELKAIVGAENVKTTLADRAYYFQDHSTDFIDLDHGYAPDVVVCPHSEEEVSKLVNLANRERLPITPRGAGTGFVGGAVAVKGGLMVDLSDMNRILRVDEANHYVTAESGATVLSIERELNKKGLTLGFDPGSGPVATIGGSVSTDQIGGDGWYSVWGSMRQRVLSIHVVTPDGSIVNTGRPLDRPTSAFNLTHLFIAAEGTLGIVTQVTVRAFPLPEAKELHLIFFDGFKAASSAVMEMGKIGLWVGIQHCVNVVNPEDESADREPASLGMLILGFAGPKEVVAAQKSRALEICSRHGGRDAGEEAAAAFWEQHHQAFPTNIAGNRVYGMESVTVPPDTIIPLYYEWRSIALKHGLRWQGGGFNLIPTQLWVMYDFENTKSGLEKKNRAMEEMLRFAAEAGATISAVHGIGFLKKKYYPLEFTDPNLIKLMRTVKAAIDPKNIMNPGKVVFD